MRERAGDVLEVWGCVAAWVDAADARQLYRCSGWLLEGVEHSWRAREREEHRCRLRGCPGICHSMVGPGGVRQRHHSPATLLRPVVWLQNWNAQATSGEGIQALAFQ